jgi:hypothetical protein
MQQTWQTNQLHEHECIVLNGEYVKPYCADR